MNAPRQQTSSGYDGNTDDCSHKWKAYVGLTAVSLIYAGWAVVARAAMEQHELPPLLLALYRCLFGSMLMLSVQALQELHSDPIRLTLQDVCLKWHMLFRRHGLRFILLGILQAGNIGGFILAANKLSALTVSIFQPLTPICAGAAAAFLNLEEFSMCQVAGLLIAACGAFSVVSLSKHGAGRDSDMLVDDWNAWLHGGPCLALNISSLALYFVLQKRPCTSCPPILVAGSSFLIALGPIGAALVCCNLNNFSFVLGTAPPLSVICYAVVLVTAFNYSVLAWATRETSPTTVATFQSLQPFFAALLLWLIHGVVPTLGQAFGGVLVTVGLLVFGFSKSSAAAGDLERLASKAVLESHNSRAI